MFSSSFNSIAEITAKYKAGLLTPSQHIQNELNKLMLLQDRHNKYYQINAISQILNISQILSLAHESSERYKHGKPLSEIDGIPITIKDNTGNQCKGVKLNNGSKFLSQQNIMPSTTASHIDILLKNGAIILCQTTAPEMSWKGATSSPLYGITRCPYNLMLSAGGSSGGAGALASVGINGLHLGSDGGGSVRIPASCCGVVGFKPTHNIGKHNGGNRFPFRSHVGPLTLFVDDCRIYMKLMIENRCFNIDNSLLKYDFNKLNNLDFSTNNICNKSINGLKIAVCKTMGGTINEQYIDTKVWNSIINATQIFKNLGCKIEFVEPTGLGSLSIKYHEIMNKLRAISLYSNYKIKYRINEKNQHLIDSTLLKYMNWGKNNVNSVRLIKCINLRERVCEIMNNFANKYDLIITPTIPSLPPMAKSYDKDYEMDRLILDSYTCLFNLTHQPAISINCNFGRNNEPIGMQIASSLYKDDIVLRAAYQFQKHYNQNITIHQQYSNSKAKL